MVAFAGEGRLLDGDLRPFRRGGQVSGTIHGIDAEPEGGAGINDLLGGLMSLVGDTELQNAKLLQVEIAAEERQTTGEEIIPRRRIVGTEETGDYRAAAAAPAETV